MSRCQSQIVDDATHSDMADVTRRAEKAELAAFNICLVLVSKDLLCASPEPSMDGHINFISGEPGVRHRDLVTKRDFA